VNKREAEVEEEGQKEGRPAVLILPADFSREIKIKVDKDKETEGIGHSGYEKGIPYWIS
jgi:hypothetical protein